MHKTRDTYLIDCDATTSTNCFGKKVLSSFFELNYNGCDATTSTNCFGEKVLSSFFELNNEIIEL